MLVLVGALANPEKVAQNAITGPLLRSLSRTGDVRVSAAWMMAGFQVLRSGLLIALQRSHGRLTAEARASLVSRVFETYLRGPYSLHLRRSSAESIRNTLEHSSLLFGIPADAIGIVQELVVLAGLIALMASIAPLEALVTSVMILALGKLSLSLTRKAANRLGSDEYLVSKQLLSVAQQGLYAAKEIRILGRESAFSKMLGSAQDSAGSIAVKRALLNALPRGVMESIFVVGSMSAIALLLMRGNDEAIVPLLGMYAYVGFRAIPATQRIVSAVVLLRYSSALAERVSSDLEAAKLFPATDSAEATPFRDCVSFDQVGFAHDPARGPVLRNATLTIRRGQFIGIVGRTGAGKSSLLDLFMGLLEPDTGLISADGRPLRERVPGWYRNIGYVPQSVYLADSSLRRNVAFGVEDDAIDPTRVWNALRLARLDEFVRNLPQGLDTLVGDRGLRFSGGERQRLAIARALYEEREILVLDEATASLDPGTEREIVGSIGQLRRERTLIVVTHRMQTIEQADKIFWLETGRVRASGTLEELMEHEEFRALAGSRDG